MDDNPDPSLSVPPTIEQHPEPHEFKPPVTQKHNRWLPLAIIVVVVLLLAGGGYVYWQHSQSKPAAKSNPVATHQAQSQTDSAANQKVATKTYSSTNFGVTVNYPEAWSVTSDTAAGLIITSPVAQLTDASGSKVNGREVMSMVPKGQLPGAVGDGATAVLDSVKVNYTQPTGSQRSSTYLTFAQYQATTTKGGLDAIYVTGNYGYQKTQNIPSTDLASVDPLISLSFQKCADTACTSNLTALTIASADWSDTAFQAPIKTLLTSLAFQ